MHGEKESAHVQAADGVADVTSIGTDERVWRHLRHTHVRAKPVYDDDDTLPFPCIYGVLPRDFLARQALIMCVWGHLRRQGDKGYESD